MNRSEVPHDLRLRTVSTNGQTLAAQEAPLMAAGCSKVYSEKVSGAVTDRPELAKVLKRLEPGDTLVVTRLDRLARSTRDLLNILDTVAKAGAGFKSLADAWADTTTPHGKLMLTILAGLSEFERSLIRARTGDGRERAKERGPAAQAQCPSARRGDRADAQWRDPDGHRADLRGEPHNGRAAARGLGRPVGVPETLGV
jgi:DNA invertase Pin-like site-specific DNA recombinase